MKISKNIVGFTLIEVLMTIAVLAVILSLGAPSLSRFVTENRLFSAQTSIVGSLALARNEAIRRNRTVYVTGQSTTAGAEFSSGWTVWEDTNRSAAKDAGEPVIRTIEGIEGLVRLGGVQHIGFDARGEPVGGASTLILCSTSRDVEYALAIDVVPSGHAETRKLTTC